MEDSSINIQNDSSLSELNNTFEYVGDSLLKMQKAIAMYLDGVIEVMENQLEIVKDKYEEAQENLRSAEEALQQCLDSQDQDDSAYDDEYLDDSFGSQDDFAYDEENSEDFYDSQDQDTDSGEYGPSCSLEQGQVNSAEEECRKWEENYEIAQSILAQCESCKSEWEYRGALDCGGDCLLESLGNERTNEATSKLKEILELVSEYSDVSFSSEVSRQPEDVKFRDKYDEKKIIQNTDEEVKKEQIHELKIHGTEFDGRVRVARCPRCGRSLPNGCICYKSRKNIEII